MPNAELGDVTIHYKEHGEGPPCLGVMGFALDQRYWAMQVQGVTKTHRFITFDNRGIGRSNGDPVTSMKEMADDAVRLLDHLGIEKTVVYGLSMGGAVSQRIVLDHPDRVSAIILGITFARPIEFMRRQHEVARFVIRNGGPEMLLEASLMRMFTPEFFEVGGEVIDQMVKANLAEGTGPSAEVLLAQLDALDGHDVLHELPRVSVPTLVLGAKMDQMVPGLGSKEIAAAVPGAELVMFETGHGCSVEEMEKFNGAVHDFLKRLPAS
jgi:pimeloyl-ACP methyl ester carboxylesterase